MNQTQNTMRGWVTPSRGGTRSCDSGPGRRSAVAERRTPGFIASSTIVARLNAATIVARSLEQYNCDLPYVLISPPSPPDPCAIALMNSQRDDMHAGKPKQSFDP